MEYYDAYTKHYERSKKEMPGLVMVLNGSLACPFIHAYIFQADPRILLPVKGLGRALLDCLR